MKELNENEILMVAGSSGASCRGDIMGVYAGTLENFVTLDPTRTRARPNRWAYQYPGRCSARSTRFAAKRPAIGGRSVPLPWCYRWLLPL